MGQLTINGPFSIAMLVYQRVSMVNLSYAPPPHKKIQLVRTNIFTIATGYSVEVSNQGRPS